MVYVVVVGVSVTADPNLCMPVPTGKGSDAVCVPYVRISLMVSNDFTRW